MPSGRPPRSTIRQNIVEILYCKGEAYGYEICQLYNAIFPAVSMRSIYYNLAKGVELKEFKVTKVTHEKGDYSWGSEAEKTYYGLDANAAPRLNQKVKRYLERQKG